MPVVWGQMYLQETTMDTFYAALPCLTLAAATYVYAETRPGAFQRLIATLHRYTPSGRREARHNAGVMREAAPHFAAQETGYQRMRDREERLAAASERQATRVDWHRVNELLAEDSDNTGGGYGTGRN
jgi:hypothetical protein